MFGFRVYWLIKNTKTTVANQTASVDLRIDLRLKLEILFRFLRITTINRSNIRLCNAAMS